MTKGAPGEIYDVPTDPEERKRYLIRAGLITTRAHNEARTFSPQKDYEISGQVPLGFELGENGQLRPSPDGTTGKNQEHGNQ